MQSEASYNVAVSKHRKQAKTPKRWLWVIFGFYFMSLLLIVPLIVVLHLIVSDYTDPPIILFLQLFVLYLSSVILIALGLFVRVRYGEIASSGHRFISRHSANLKESQQMTILYPVLQEIGLGVGVSPDMLVLPTPQSTIFPSVEKYDDKVVLILPLGFMSFLKKEPEEARFILAHELSHIRQDDLHLFRESEAYSKVLLPLIIIIQGLSFVIKSYAVSTPEMEIDTAKTFFLLFVTEPLTILCVIIAAAAVKRTRMNSEELADNGAALAVNEQAGIRIFEKIGVQEETSDSRHPTPNARIKNLNKFSNG